LDFSVKIYFSNQFEALRKIYCGSYNDFVHSIFRSEVWSDNSGGKTKSSFLKSHDHKYVIKVVKSGEIKMFETMGDSYFEYMCRSFT
jgi:1-phosphatidylinositol-3-phosphate 5-kinase